MKTKELITLLAQRWPLPDNAFFPEFRGGTGWSCEQRADAIAMDLWPSHGLELFGFEVKTSRADWLREMKQPWKADFMKKYCDRWYLVVSDLSIVKYAYELPPDWGLMFAEEGRLVTMIEAKKLAPEPIPRTVLASLMRRVAKQEQANLTSLEGDCLH
jgi:hypothetical protein